jgi:hypothetical protein
VRIFFSPVTNEKKHGPNIIIIQYFQYSRSHLFIRTIIESKKERIAIPCFPQGKAALHEEIWYAGFYDTPDRTNHADAIPDSPCVPFRKKNGDA